LASWRIGQGSRKTVVVEGASHGVMTFDPVTVTARIEAAAAARRRPLRQRRLF
jgi:hypothetical protein